MSSWSPSSWRTKPIFQQPDYGDLVKLESAESMLKGYPPLVFAGEVESLKQKLARVYHRDAFLLQGGDCAETFSHFSANSIRDTLKVILQMSVVMTFASGSPIVKVGRMAGQFAKPRSSNFEVRDGESLPSYRGDMINGVSFDSAIRQPDPIRMIQCYNQSASTLNFLRSLAKGGFSSLQKVHAWNLDFMKNNPNAKSFREIADDITSRLKFIDACGLDLKNSPQLKEVDLYTSHEALLLNYEEALTRQSSLDDKWYDCSAHMVWIGERTRDLDGAHVEFFRGINNPIGVKISDKANSDDLLRLIDVLNPNNEAGRLSLIVRMGAEAMAEKYPSLLDATLREDKKVIWVSDPMHGNTFTSSLGYKTRAMDSILKEVKTFFDIHSSRGSYAGGLHLEMTGADVTECLGGLNEVTENDLNRFYETACDPRLNCDQSLELAFYITDVLKTQADNL